MSNITLPRAAADLIEDLVEDLVENAFDDGAAKLKGPSEQTIKAIAALRAALAEPVLEPDALRRWVNANDDAPETEFQRGYDAARRWVREVGLPALAEPDATPEPATDEQIVKAGGECAVVDDEYLLDFRDGWHEAERFHGIRKEDKT